MPIINIQMLEGRTPEQKEQLIKEVTDAVVRTTGARKEAVTIIINDMKKENYGHSDEILK
ncbi:MAG TPA: 2-hydroxymuconate tautomerase family protein [Candidatus Enterococcus avicola]|uniref:Tautomerase n=1 Tax=Candidatus Enterococcus avicola TaxID=2838561 RepID=A0A9D2F580_9ENTE|nr:2-hydroxymuconate tautomerase family protein [Candidatus Enterococcus avicola]